MMPAVSCDGTRRQFTETALGLSMTLLNAGIDLISFSGILYSIYPPLFAALLVYSIGGTGASLYLGRSLVGLNFQQEAQEANFRCRPCRCPCICSSNDVLFRCKRDHGIVSVLDAHDELTAGLRPALRWNPHSVAPTPMPFTHAIWNAIDMLDALPGMVWCASVRTRRASPSTAARPARSASCSSAWRPPSPTTAAC